MATQISSAVVQKDDSEQLLKQTPSLHSGLEASHHLHRLEFRWPKELTIRGSPAGGDTELRNLTTNSTREVMRPFTGCDLTVAKVSQL